MSRTCCTSRFACWLSPVIGLVYAQTGLFSPRASEEERQLWQEQGEAIATDLGAAGPAGETPIASPRPSS